MADDLPENFYKFKNSAKPRRKTNSAVTRHPIDTVPLNLQNRPVDQPDHDPNMPQNFYKYHHNVPKQTVSLPKQNSQVPVEPSDPEQFELEQRLKRLSSKRSPKPPSHSSLEKRLERLQGFDKHIPSVSDLENRLNQLKESEEADGEDATDEKRPKMMKPLVRVMSLKPEENPEDIIKEVQEEVNIGEAVYRAGKRPKSVTGTGITEQMTPDELLELLKAQMGNEEDDENSESDSTHDSFDSELLTDDESDQDGLISEDISSSSQKKLEYKDWKKVAKEMIKEAEREAKSAEKRNKHNKDFDMKF